MRITRDQKQRFKITPEAFCEAAEKELYQALQAAEKTNRQRGSVQDLFMTFLPLIPAINHFFDSVLVMAEDAVQRANRLGLLQHIAGLAEGVADLSKMEGF